MLVTAILGIIGLVFCVVGVVLLMVARGGARKAALIQQIPTSPATSVASQPPGTLVEVKGTLRCDAPIAAELPRRTCAYTSLVVEREREVREQDANNEWKTNRQSETVSHTSLGSPFYVEDSSGQVLVRPDGADVDAMTVVDRFEQANSGTTLSIGGLTLNLGVGDDTVGYRYRESILPVDGPVYVLGVVAGDGSIGSPAHGRSDQAFTISYRSEETLVRSTSQAAFWLRVGGAGALVLGVALMVLGVVLGRL
jgi:hypothetical protein